MAIEGDGNSRAPSESRIIRGEATRGAEYLERGEHLDILEERFAQTFGNEKNIERKLDGLVTRTGEIENFGDSAHDLFGYPVRWRKRRWLSLGT